MCGASVHHRAGRRRHALLSAWGCRCRGSALPWVAVCVLLGGFVSGLAQTYQSDGFTWADPLDLRVANGADFARENEVVVLRLRDLGLSGTGELRLVDPQAPGDEDGETGGNDLAVQTDGDLLSFTVDVDAGASREYRLYCSAEGRGAPHKDYVAASDLRVDLAAGRIGNSLVDVRFGTPNASPRVTAMSYKGERLIGDGWLYLRQEGESFRSRGPVTRLDMMADGPVRKRILLHVDPDNEAARSTYAFTVAIEVSARSPVVLMEVVTTPATPTPLSAQLFATVWPVDPAKDVLNLFRHDDVWGSIALETSEAYGRLRLDVVPPWALLFDRERRHGVALGAARGEVPEYVFCIDFRRFELRRPHVLASTAEPYVCGTTFDFGDDPERIALLERARRRPLTVTVGGKPCPLVSRLTASRHLGDDALPAADVRRPAPEAAFEPAISESGRSVRVQTRDVALELDMDSGALSGLCVGSEELELQAPGGIGFVRWPQRGEIAASGDTSGWHVTADRAEFRWRSGDVRRTDTITAQSGYVEWTAEVKNDGGETMLLESRFSLPLFTDPDGWLFWDGAFNYRLARGRPRRGFTTLAPGSRASQGIFPAACVWNSQLGVAVGLRPLDIHSFYGATAEPEAGAERAFNNLLRLVIPAGESRTAAYIIYAVDPNWGWRSCLARYYSFFPDVFAAPNRDDIWGLYTATGPERVTTIGDQFIDVCRRYRIGGMELYAPFTKTGEFFPDTEPCLARLHESGETRLNREQMQQAFEVCNIASCNLSYVIPTKCERALALGTYADSIIREKSGENFLRDYWCVISKAPHAGGREKLAGMFGWGNRFGERLKRDIERIVTEYKPDGFYFDNGAFNWCDYGRQLPFSSFDDDGRVYTNAGIAYALIQDDLREFAPSVHRNPGEFIQYFSGFRGQSHLTNCTTTQTNYVRSHRLIMGDKPIFVGHPRSCGSRFDLQKTLLAGGLPWMCNTMLHRAHRLELVRGFADVCIAVARAGWRPVTGAAVDRSEVRLERFGDGIDCLLVVANTEATPRTVRLEVNGAAIGARGGVVFGDFFERAPVLNEVEPGAGITALRFTVAGRETLVLRASAVVEAAESALSVRTERHDGAMRYTIATAAQQALRLSLNPPFGCHFEDGTQSVELQVTGVRVLDRRALSVVSYHPSEVGVLGYERLRRAAPVTVLVAADAGTEEYYAFRRIKGFLELQAKLLGQACREIELRRADDPGGDGEVVVGLASRPLVRRLLAEMGTTLPEVADAGVVAFSAPTGRLIIAGASERGLRRALWDYLGRIEAPLPGDELKTEALAVPQNVVGNVRSSR